MSITLDPFQYPANFLREVGVSVLNVNNILAYNFQIKECEKDSIPAWSKLPDKKGRILAPKDFIFGQPTSIQHADLDQRLNGIINHAKECGRDIVLIMHCSERKYDILHENLITVFDELPCLDIQQLFANATSTRYNFRSSERPSLDDLGTQVKQDILHSARNDPVIQLKLVLHRIELSASKGKDFPKSRCEFGLCCQVQTRCQLLFHSVNYVNNS
jgi:hypothetical protein